MAKKPETILYNTLHLPETKNLYFDDSHLFDFEAEIVEVFQNVLEENKRNLLILNQSAFYPTSGGQANDTGSVTITTGDTAEEYQVVDVIKVGKVVMHKLDKELPEGDFKGKKVAGKVNEERRAQL